MRLPNWFAAAQSHWVDYIYQFLFPLGIKAFFWNIGAFLVYFLLLFLISYQKRKITHSERYFTEFQKSLIVLWIFSGIFFTPLAFIGSICIGFYVTKELLRLTADPHTRKFQKAGLIVEVVLISFIQIMGIVLLVYLWMRYSFTVGLVVIASLLISLVAGIASLIKKLHLSAKLSSILVGFPRKRLGIKITLILFNILCAGTFIGSIFLPIHAVPLQTAPESATFSFTAVTYNIRNAGASEQDPRNSWINRREYLVEYLDSMKLDFFGVQEAYFSQLEYIRTHLSNRNYAYTGVGRNDGVKGGEHASIFYDSEKYQFLDGDTFWLSPTSSIPSKQWEKSNYRICTWALFEHKSSLIRFFVFNTHLAESKYKGVHEKSVELIIQKMVQICGNLPNILMGDFNMVNDSDSYRYVTQNDSLNLTDSYVDFHNNSAPFDYTNNQFGQVQENEKKRIDYLFLSPNIYVNNCSILKDTYSNGLYYSDHFPVILKATVVI